MSSKNTRRSKFLIYPRFQLSLIFTNVAIMATGLTLVGLQFSRSIQKLQQLGLEAKLPADHAYFKFLSWHSTQVFGYFVTAFIVSVFVSAMVTLVLSQKLAGPVLRMRGYFSKICESGFPDKPIQFRNGDFFSDLPAIINKAIARLKSDSSGKRDRNDRAA